MSQQVRLTEENKDQLLGQLFPITELYAEEAFIRRQDVYVYPEINAISVIRDGRPHFFRGGVTPLNLYGNSHIADNKHLTKVVLGAAGIPVSNGMLVKKSNRAELKKELVSLRYPVVVKPNAETAKGTDVIVNIPDFATLDEHLNILFMKILSVISRGICLWINRLSGSSFRWRSHWCY